jgi:hypothetical protein
MRTAICLSGLAVSPQVSVPLNWQEECGGSFCRHLLAHFPNPDVFIYTGQPYPADQQFIDTIKPVAYVVEEQVRHPHMEDVLRKVNYGEPGHYNAYSQQIYGWKRVGELKTAHEQATGAKYDIVVRTRPDFLYFKDIKPDMLELDKLNTLHPKTDRNLANEFAIGPDNIMSLYFGQYDWLLNEGEKFLNKDNFRLYYHHLQIFCSATILSTYLIDQMKVPVAEQKLPEGCTSPFQVYRITYRHKLGCYESDGYPPLVD